MGIITKHPFDINNKEDFLKVRDELAKEGRLGGSDIGAAVGDNKYKSPYALWCEKVGVYEPDDLSEKEAIKQGVMFEDGVAKRFELETGLKVEQVPYIFTNSDAPHLFASPDRLVTDGESGLECKTAKEIVMKRFPHGDFPQSYFDQCMCYLKVTELKRWYLAIVVYSVAFNIYLMTTDEEEYRRWLYLKERRDALLDMTDEEKEEWERRFAFLEACYFIDKESLDATELAAANFMHRVSEGKSGNMDVWPIEEIDGSESTSKALAHANPKAKPASVVTFKEGEEFGLGDDLSVFTTASSSEVIRLVAQRMEYQQTINELENEMGLVENRLMAIMKDKEAFVVPNCKVTYKESVPKKFAKVSEVESYFGSRNLPIPPGMITLSTPSRGIRFFPKKSKK